MKKKLSFVILLLCLSLLTPPLSGCGEDSVYFLESDLEINILDGNKAAAEREMKSFLKDFENRISLRREGSELRRFNAAAAGEEVPLSAHVYAVFEAAVRAAETTDGAFNPFLYPLSLAWGFTDDGIVPPEAPPDGETLAGLLAHTAVSGVELTETGVIKKDGEMKADLGGIAKGYAAEYCIRIAEKHGAKNALVSISGNIYALGRYKTGAADRPFRIAVTDPRAADNHNAYFCKAAVENTSVSISGDYHRYFMREGKRYSHILSPYTGRPAESGVMSVAVLGADGAASDAYATAIFVMGTEQGLAFCEKNGVTAIVMGEDYRYAVAGDISISDVYEKYEQTLY